MSNPNFVSDLVAMAKAFEELPAVKAELERAVQEVIASKDRIQSLELRLIDLKTELDGANANTRKVEVERDHAERMFLETDDRLNAFRRLVQAFDTDVKSLVQAAEPEPEVQVATAPLQGYEAVQAEQGQGEDRPTSSNGASTDKAGSGESTSSYGDPGPAIGDAFTLGQGAADPTTAPIPTSSDSPTSDLSVSDAASSLTEAVSVQPDPTPTTPDVQSPEASSSANAGETSASTPETAGSMQHSEVAERPTDPTAAATPTETGADASSTGVSVSDTASVPTTTEPSSTSTSESVDDVGYHNEPKIIGTGAEAWAEWDKWCERMNKRYPHSAGGWPPRTQAAQ